jgi:hypothetical protein
MQRDLMFCDAPAVLRPTLGCVIGAVELVGTERGEKVKRFLEAIDRPYEREQLAFGDFTDGR